MAKGSRAIILALLLGASSAGAENGITAGGVGDVLKPGYDYQITSTAPYKVFTSGPAQLNITLAAGTRSFHHLTLTCQVCDIWRNPVAQFKVPLDVPGESGASFPLPPISLPQLGWYRIDTALYGDDGSLLVERTHFISRTVVDPNLPIPDKEVSGWNDLETFKMVGMGLHRFTSNNFNDMDAALSGIPRANELKISYFCLLGNRADCTPSNVEKILSNHKEIPLLEIMNEPDQQGVSPEEYVTKYLQPCYEAAHRLIPGIKILGPSKCGIELEWMKRFFAAGGARYVDAISVHTYERNNSMDVYHWNWKLAKLKEMMTANNCGNKPLYVTEHGYLGNYHDFLLRPEWQAWSVFDEYLTLDRVGVSPDPFSILLCERWRLCRLQFVSRRSGTGTLFPRPS